MSDQSQAPDLEQAVRHWNRTRTLMFITLGVWFIFSFVVHFFARDLNEFTFIGFPFGFYMAAQGSLIVFVILIFWFAARQNKIDEECGFGED